MSMYAKRPCVALRASWSEIEAYAVFLAPDKGSQSGLPAGSCHGSCQEQSPEQGEGIQTPRLGQDQPPTLFHHKIIKFNNFNMLCATISRFPATLWPDPCAPCVSLLSLLPAPALASLVPGLPFPLVSLAFLCRAPAAPTASLVLPPASLGCLPEARPGAQTFPCLPLADACRAPAYACRTPADPC